MTALLLVAVLAGLGGCTTVRYTHPPRTATEQFLLSQSAQEAVSQLTFEQLRGRKVYIDTTFFAASEREFVIGELRAQMLLAGIRLVETDEEANIIMEVRSGGVGIDFYEFLLGIPALPVGTVASAAGTPSPALMTPELALIKNTRQLGTASVAMVAYWSDTGEVISSSGPHVGRSFRMDWWFFGLGPKSVSNIPTTKPVE